MLSLSRFISLLVEYYVWLQRTISIGLQRFSEYFFQIRRFKQNHIKSWLKIGVCIFQHLPHIIFCPKVTERLIIKQKTSSTKCKLGRIIRLQLFNAPNMCLSKLYKLALDLQIHIKTIVITKQPIKLKAK